MLACDDIMPTGWTPAAGSSTLEEWTRTFSRGQQCSCFTINVFYGVRAGAESLRVGSENMETLMTVVDRLDELRASSVGRRECSSTRQRTAPREPDTWTSMYTHRVSPAHGRRAVATAQAHVMEVSRSRGICAALCIRRTLCRHVTIGTPMVIFAV